MPRGRKPVVVDTNVAIVANRREGGSYICASACASELLRLRSIGTLILDDQELILTEYRNYLNYNGQPGVGDAFFRWFFNNRGRPDLCREVAISHIDHEWRKFEEFPENKELSDFDKSDQKFVAVAIAGGPTTEIVQASDHKWLKWHPALTEAGVRVHFLCERELLETLQGKKK